MQRTLLALNLKKSQVRYSFKKCSAEQKSPSFLLHRMLYLFSTINLLCLLDINIFGRDGIIQTWYPKILISSACARFIEENWSNIWCSLMHLKKSIIRLQITAFKIVTNGHHYTKTAEYEKFIFSINNHTSIKKHSNQD